jgi:cholesterol oxidase
MERTETNSPPPSSPLSRPLAAWAKALHTARQGAPADPFDCDVLIVGSGYGGSVAAARLAGLHELDGRPSRVVVLERGKAYAQGAFPTRQSELPGHVRFVMAHKAKVRGSLDGLFDLRLNTRMTAVLANGLGGGSLINAGVMLPPDTGTMAQSAWPKALDLTALQQAMHALVPRLQASPRPAAQAPLLKEVALHRLSDTSQRVPVTVDWDKCVNCGDCATGCNHDAKLSLDKTLLLEAACQGAQLVTQAAVTQVQRASQGPGWEVTVEHTDLTMAAAEPEALVVRARRVIVAAGTFGSTELLMRSHRRSPQGLSLSSRRLGRKVSTNGDLLVAIYGQKHKAQALGQETLPLMQRQVGPTITRMIDLRPLAPDGQGHVVQELAVPGPLRNLFAEVFCTAWNLSNFGHFDSRCHRPTDHDPLMRDEVALARTQVLALIGHDDGRARLRMPWHEDATQPVLEGALCAFHPKWEANTPWHAQTQELRALVKQSGEGGTVLPLPLWQPTSGLLASSAGSFGGMAVTAHPLGGCTMADKACQGVVNHLGQVFKHTEGHEVHEDLLVLDGSILPGSLGINPALTISALAQHSLDHLIAHDPAWALKEGISNAQPVRPPEVVRAPEKAYGPDALHREGTTIEITEQLLHTMDASRWAIEVPTGWQLVLKITLRFVPTQVHTLMEAHAESRTLQVDPATSNLQVMALYHPSGKAPERRVADEGEVLVQFPLEGHLQFMHREASNPLCRTSRGFAAFMLNHGTRDLIQKIKQGFDKSPSTNTPQGGTADSPSDLLRDAGNFLRIASHAGEVRRFDYQLRTQAATPQKEALEIPLGAPGLQTLVKALEASMANKTLAGHKRVTYNVAGNPWRQLLRMTLTQAPLLRPDAASPAYLFVNLQYFAKVRVPLLRLVKFDNMIDALADLLQLGAWLARCLLQLHFWSLRAPDTAPPRKAQRLPQALPCLPEPEIIELPVGNKGKIRLTRYPKKGCTPVLMIHGYSASGTTFAHASLKPSLAEHLHKADLEPWVLDMRSSPGLEATGDLPWTFEEIAYNDIPLAIEKVCQLTGQAKTHVVAHCMGSAMFWMALLGDHGPLLPHEQHPEQRKAMAERIGRVVLSQIAPIMVFSPMNVLRAYVSEYVQRLLPTNSFSFNPTRDGRFDAVLDRLLNTQLYPSHEFWIENPKWPCKETPWVRTRHRMDALYGRDFNATRVSPEFLAAIDDHFGPMNLQTIRQAIHFARHHTLTTADGRNEFVTPARMARAFTFECLYVHGEENGLSDIEGSREFERFVAGLGPQYAARLHMHRVPGHGHQDCLVGVKAKELVFDRLTEFLKARSVEATAPTHTPMTHALRPSHGPWMRLLSDDGPDGRPLGIRVGLGFDPLLGPPMAYVLTLYPGNGEPPEPKYHPWPDASRDTVYINLPAAALQGFERAGFHLIYQQPGVPESRKYLLAIEEKTVDEVLERIKANDSFLPQRDSLLDLRQARRALQAVAKPEPVRLVVASCRYPAGIIDAASQLPANGKEREDHSNVWRPGPADLGDERLASSKPDMLWLVGDQIYADPTVGLFDPVLNDMHTHRASYRQWLSHLTVQRTLNGPLWMSLPDDHEFANNWAPYSGRWPAMQAEQALRFQAGWSAIQQHVSGPMPHSATRAFRFDGLACLMLDTRTQRERRDMSNVTSARICSSADWSTLSDFIQTHGAQSHPKVIASPAMLLPRRRTSVGPEGSPLGSDAWDGYPASLHALLSLLWQAQAQEVWFVSGDEHLASECTIELFLAQAPDGPRLKLRTVHSGALYAPYPFANSRVDDFQVNETFEVQGGPLGLMCQVQTEFDTTGRRGPFALQCHPPAPGQARWDVSVEWL